MRSAAASVRQVGRGANTLKSTLRITSVSSVSFGVTRRSGLSDP
jgi:hypothetical protein